MKHQVFLSLLLQALLICAAADDDFEHTSNCTLNGSPTILTITCKEKTWKLQCREDGGYLNMSFSCLDKPKKTGPFQFKVSNQGKYCFDKDCQKIKYGQSTCDNNDKISISALTDRSYNIQLKLPHSVQRSDCKFDLWSADNQTGIFLTNKTWIEALQFCKTLDSTLVEITNQTLRDAVIKIMKDKAAELKNGVWVGLERSIFGTNSGWIWTSKGEKIGRDLNISFPDDPLNNHCGKVVLVQDEVKVDDEDCHESLPFICQA
ncbi:uncharacterized protein LOC111610492 [Xiphophorus maculatus]|uniref:uncharacterized protein LOC111610492 n=1 Tax=Xiphophorus maculatus TaxID=8083 RepID=UPI000C6ED21C|nr:uncharacterized protein LOC111610492 [Xiphophorus maculatus]